MFLVPPEVERDRRQQGQHSGQEGALRPRVLTGTWGKSFSRIARRKSHAQVSASRRASLKRARVGTPSAITARTRRNYRAEGGALIDGEQGPSSPLFWAFPQNTKSRDQCHRPEPDPVTKIPALVECQSAGGTSVGLGHVEPPQGGRRAAGWQRFAGGDAGSGCS